MGRATAGGSREHWVLTGHLQQGQMAADRKLPHGPVCPRATGLQG